MGNTCYVNAVVQALMAIPSFSHMLKVMPDTIDSDDDDDDENVGETLIISDSPASGDKQRGQSAGKPKKSSRPVIL